MTHTQKRSSSASPASPTSPAPSWDMAQAEFNDYIQQQADDALAPITKLKEILFEQSQFKNAWGDGKISQIQSVIESILNKMLEQSEGVYEIDSSNLVAWLSESMCYYLIHSENSSRSKYAISDLELANLRDVHEDLTETQELLKMCLEENASCICKNNSTQMRIKRLINCYLLELQGSLEQLIDSINFLQKI